MKESDISRIIEMAWEDRTPFDAIYDAYGLNEREVKAMIKSQLKLSKYRHSRNRLNFRRN